ncbi:MAG: response regulator transcription factor [Spirulina sp. SIO3F2]|nr:response regulator transcription factor [Spirulina sp. SIO3F2]
MPLSILVADDNLAIRRAIQDYLELEGGYSIIPAQNGEEALRQLSIYHPHLIIADIKMPLMDGYTLVKTLRRRPEYRLIPVVFLTECAQTVDRIQGYKVGCDAYLPKPFELEELLAVVQNLLARSQVMQAELRFSQYPPPESLQPVVSMVAPTVATAAETRSAQRDDDAEKALLGIQVEPLSSREQEVLELLIQGCSNTDMGKTLHLSPRTIEKYVSRLLRKTQTPNRTTLVRFAIQYQLLEH